MTDKECRKLFDHGEWIREVRYYGTLKIRDIDLSTGKFHQVKFCAPYCPFCGTSASNHEDEDA